MLPTFSSKNSNSYMSKVYQDPLGPKPSLVSTITRYFRKDEPNPPTVNELMVFFKSLNPGEKEAFCEQIALDEHEEISF